ncbi:hypothetical protein LSH36_51g01009 [Paralvinella palmiformis]|uniref:Uncharacterized protein n=1 Tax=Paralvinella palmiformis TaxID=53620 RepID=A0AAD9K5N9_9ANNE|nr:hypothetical protein LSH36_51g01009 [Paralvinella palmiformis]
MADEGPQPPSKICHYSGPLHELWASVASGEQSGSYRGLVPSHYSHTSPLHASLILEQLNVQRYYGAFCDIVLRVEDVDVRLHKCVLAASSARLQTMVYSMRQECGDLLTLKDVSLPGFWPILDYIYTGVLKLDNGTVQEVLMAAQLLEIRDVEKICLEYVKIIQNGGSSSSNSSGTTPASPADTKLQNSRLDKGINGNNVVVTTPNSSSIATVPPPLFTLNTSCVTNGQYLTPISPVQSGEPPDKQNACNMTALNATPTPQPAPIQQHTMLASTSEDLSRTATPNQMPHTPNPAPVPPPIQGSAPPGGNPSTAMGFPSLPVAPSPSHVPSAVTAIINGNMSNASTAQVTVPTQTTSAYQMTHLEQSFPLVHMASNHGNVLPRGFPGMPIDTNYVEDYLKLIESFQGESQQLAQQVQQYHQQQQQQQQNMPHHAQQQPIQVPLSHHGLPAGVTSSEPNTPQNGTRLQVTTMPQPEYINITPQSYEVPSSIEPQPAVRDPLKLPQVGGALMPTTTTTGCACNPTTTSAQQNTRVRTYSNTRCSTNPIGHMSAEEVRRTVLNVLSKFDDDDDDDDDEADANDGSHEDEMRKKDVKESVPPLTSFLNFTPLAPVKQVETTEDRAAPSSVCDSQELYGDLQIVSSDSDNGENEPGNGDAGIYGDSLETSGTETSSHLTSNDEEARKDSILMKIRKSAMKSFLPNDGTENNAFNASKDNENLIHVGDVEINLNMDPLQEKPSTESDGQKPNQVKKVKKEVPKDSLVQQEAVFKDTVKDPNMLNRPLKKRIRLRLKKKFQCNKCGREFVRADALESHLEQHEKCALLSCHVCNQKFARVSEMTRHMRDHTAEFFRCQHCESEFQSSKDYKQHMDSVHKEVRAFSCTYSGCQYRAARLSNLEKHMAIHADMKRYHCNRCGKSFAQPNGLRSHQKSCLQERGYLCDICGAKFNYLQSMKSHRLLHTGEKPYECSDCGAKFTDPRNLKRHRRIHDNLYPYKCPQCEKRFRHSNSLKAHTNTHERKKAGQEFDFELVRKRLDDQFMAMTPNSSVTTQNAENCRTPNIDTKPSSSSERVEMVSKQDLCAARTGNGIKNMRRKQPVVSTVVSDVDKQRLESYLEMQSNSVELQNKPDSHQLTSQNVEFLESRLKAENSFNVNNQIAHESQSKLQQDFSASTSHSLDKRRKPGPEFSLSLI